MNKNQQKIINLAKKKDISKMKYREIAREISTDNPQTVIYHMDQLVKKGLLYLDANKRHRVAKPKAFAVDNFFNIPVIGSANCGPAMELAQEDIQSYLKISTKALERTKPSGLFAIKAVGNSMDLAENIKGGPIENSDYVIIDHEKIDPSNGDYILSVINGAANIKRFYQDGSEIRLLSESSLDIPPIVLHEDDLDAVGYCVNGTVVRVIKN